nr:MAG TPA: hypothetical protein [Caudoviricetes sp.]
MLHICFSFLSLLFNSITVHTLTDNFVDISFLPLYNYRERG